MSESKSSKVSREERKKRILLKHKFENRITVTKFGKEALDSGDYGLALKRFVEYLTTLADVKSVPDVYSLRVNHFDTSKDLTEMLMISHIYFEMARIYDAAPKFHEDSKKCLEQFVHFSANQPYQVVNSELVRKHLKKTAFKNPDIFRNAYQQIFVQSKKCYVVTYCFGESHPVTAHFREFKDHLLDSEHGRVLVSLYYRFSSVAIERWGQAPFMRLGSYFVRLLLLLFSKTILRFIIGKC